MWPPCREKWELVDGKATLNENQKAPELNISPSLDPEASMTAGNLGSSSLCTALGGRKRALHIINALGRGMPPQLVLSILGNKS